ncbi:MAG: response regulator [Myxococcaceae bacterium]|nr:response regulator [Myxococcaceae bacterium]
MRSSVATAAAGQSTRQPVAAERPLVLVVDPDQSARAVLEVALARDGFDVWSVATAEQGLDVLRRGRTPDVIVLESDLGNDDGFSFCAELKGNPRTTGVPVVLLARRDDKNVGNLAEVVGVDEAIQKPAFARDVASLVRFELVRHRSRVGQSLRFSERSLPAAHLLRALLTSTRSGTFSLADGLATISFQEGVIVQATFGERWGVDAVVRALALTFGDYSVQLGPVRPTGFHCSLRDVVSLVLPRLAHWSALSMRSLPLDAVLAVDFARLAQSLPTMPDDVNRLVQLFDGRRSVRQVLFDSPFDEVLTLEVSTRLYLMGVVGPVVTAEAPQPRSAPRLFEPRSAEADELMRQLFDGSTEIRSSDVEPARVDDDWVMAVPGADLQVDDPAGGWTAAALPDAHLAEGLAEDVSRRLVAFNVPTVVERREPSVALQPVADFAHGAQETLSGGTMQSALRAATGDEAAVVAEFRQPPAAFEDDPTPPSPARRFTAEDRQERIVTPVLTPAVAEPAPLAEATRALTVGGEVVRTAAEQVVVVAAPSLTPAVEGELEDTFFSSGAVDAAAFEDTLPSTAPAQPRAWQSKRRVGLLVGLAVLAALVAVGVEWLFAAARPALVKPDVAAALTSPATAVEPSAEVVPPPALAPVQEEPEGAVEPTLVDVSEPLADGVRAYQNGEYAKAVAILEQVVADDPKSLQGWLMLGQAQYDAGHAEAAKGAAQKVLELEPKNAKVHLLLATIAHDAGDKAAMRLEVERYLELEPEGEHAAEARALLR